MYIVEVSVRDEKYELPHSISADFRALKTNVPAESHHVKAFLRAKGGIRLGKDVHIRTAKDAVIVSALCREQGVDFDFAEIFAGYQKDLWLFVEAAAGGVVDFGGMMARLTITHKYQILREILDEAMNEFIITPALHAATLLRIFTWNFNDCFDEAGEDVTANVVNLDRVRSKAISLLVNPFSSDATFRGRSRESKISCEGISRWPEPAVGKSRFVSEEEFKDRVRTFGCDFAKRVSGLPADVLENVVLAGGSVAGSLLVEMGPANMPGSDVDWFIVGKTTEERRTTYDAVMRALEGPDTIFTVFNSVTTVYIVDVPRKLQIITGRYSNAAEVISRFDLAHIQMACSVCGDNPVITPRALEAAATGLSTIVSSIRMQNKRFVKCLYNGFDIATSEHIEHPETLAATNPLVKQELMGFMTWYYPRSTDCAGPMLKDYHHAMVMRDASADVVTDSVAVAMSKVTIDGNFESDYLLFDYEKFTAESVIARGVPRRAHDTTVRGRTGPVMHRLKGAKVMSVVEIDDGAVITVSVPEGFIKYAHTLDKQVYAMYDRGNVGRALEAGGMVDFTIDPNILARAADRGFAVICSRRGVASTVADLSEGDLIDISYRIRCNFTDQRVQLIVTLIKTDDKKDDDTPSRVDTRECVEASELEYED